MQQQIKKWEQEIEKIQKTEKEMLEKNKERIKQLRYKINEAKHRMELENNNLIASVVREIYGEITPENIEKFKTDMRALGHHVPENERVQL